MSKAYDDETILELIEMCNYIQGISNAIGSLDVAKDAMIYISETAAAMASMIKLRED